MAKEVVKYKHNKILIKKFPKKGEDIQVFVKPNDQIEFLKDVPDVNYKLVGGDIVAELPNGGTITFVQWV